MAEEGLLLELLELLGTGEVEGVGPQVSPRVDEGGTQRLSGERVHDGLLGDSAGVHQLLGLADLSVGLGKLQSDGLWEVRVKPHSLLKVLLGSLGTGSATEGDESNWRSSLAILTGDFE